MNSSTMNPKERKWPPALLLRDIIVLSSTNFPELGSKQAILLMDIHLTSIFWTSIVSLALC